MQEEVVRNINGKGVEREITEGDRSLLCKFRSRERVKRELSDWFRIGVGLRQGCVMSPCLFNLLMDGVVREMEREGKGIRLRNMEGEWDVNILLFEDDAVLVAESGEKLKILVGEFEGKCANMRLKVNQEKNKVIRIGGGDEEMWSEEWGM